ncbi:MAG: hypothetical protein DRJ08_01260 [Acidobacteria bacterium]|nr:MAG: hypothetical protein DRJ14_02775 [Acidobacteriota bacterium]RLE24210.1 MAG: hypothetical protein DRJ08_01260 [Acidobacteriota bacterium]
MDLKQAKVFGAVIDIFLPCLYGLMVFFIQPFIRPIASAAYINGVGYLFSAVVLLTPLAARKLYLKGGRTLQFRLVVYAAYLLPATLGLVYFLIGGIMRYVIGFMVFTMAYYLLLGKLVFGEKDDENA